MPIPIAVAAVIFLAVIVQSFLGFGSAILAMSLLPHFISLQIAAPLYLLLGLVVEIALLVVFHQAISLSEVRRFTLATIAGIPIGIFILIRVPEQISLTVIGAIIFLYAVYGLFNFRIPAFRQRGWANGLGLLAGAMGGAYTILGPPIILYGHGKRWEPDQFKANLQAYFFISSLAILAGYLATGRYTPEVWQLFWSSLPGTLVAIAVGLQLSKRVEPETFRKTVLVGIAVLGITLVG